MTPLLPDGGTIAPPAGRPPLAHPFSGSMLLTLQIASRQARLSALEAEMTAACETAALGADHRTKAAVDPAQWSWRMWHRYLAAAMRLENTYGPRLRRLRLEISQLERLKTLLHVP